MLIAAVVLLPHLAIANKSNTDFPPLILNYDGFFDRIAKLDKPEFSTVKLAFYLKLKSNGSICPVESVDLKTKLKSRTVYFDEWAEILIPYDKQLDLDKAQLVINKQTKSECVMDMRIEAVANYGKEINPKSLSQLSNTFDLALKEQAGMMSFLMPDVEGITVISKEDLTILNINNEVGDCNGNRCTITNNQLNKLKEDLIFSSRPHRIIPYIAK